MFIRRLFHKKDSPDRRTKVLLIHGLGATSLLMKPLGMYLHRHGFQPLYFGYKVHEDLSEVIDRYRKWLLEQDLTEPYFMVTHSMGSMLSCLAFNHRDLNRPDRIVMIAPTLYGSTLAKSWYDLTKKFPAGHFFLKLIAGPMVFDILPKEKPVLPSECTSDIGVIRIVLPEVLSKLHPLLEGQHDGTTTLKDNYVPEMKDLVTITGEHNTSLLNPVLWRQVLCFLQNGEFVR